MGFADQFQQPIKVVLLLTVVQQSPDPLCLAQFLGETIIYRREMFTTQCSQFLLIQCRGEQLANAGGTPAGRERGLRSRGGLPHNGGVIPVVARDGHVSIISPTG